MTKGSDIQLGSMHGLLTRYYIAKLTKEVEAIEAVDVDGIADESDIELEALISLGLSPAELTAMNNFLKQNDITCSVEDSNEVSELEQRLAEKRKRGKAKLASVSAIGVEADGF